MAKKKKCKEMSDDIYDINYQLNEINARIMVLNNRFKDLARYTEYIAGNVNFSITYAEYLADLISENRCSSIGGQTDSWTSKRAPSFDEFKEIKG